MSTALEVVRLVNSLAIIAVEFGVSFSDLAARQRKAEMEGREFGLGDLEEMKAEAKAALEGLSAKLE